MFSSNTSQQISESGPAYIEEVFSSYLYTGNGASQTISNQIDLAGKGGLVWIKGRTGATDHALCDTVRGATFDIASNTLGASTAQTTGVTGFSSSGFSIGALAKINTSADSYVSWTFRKQSKFFDIVTYTGDGTTDRAVAHNLGSAPGAIFVKPASSGVSGWAVYHRSLGYTQRLRLNQTTAAEVTNATIGYAWGTTANPDASTFRVGDISGDPSTNQSGITYIAYLFAHDAGGFGLTGTDNVISCGTFTTDASGNATVNLGYEPQWLLIKSTTANAGLANWILLDTMRGLFVNGTGDRWLYANTNGAEAANNTPAINSTGFSVSGFGVTINYVYIAIRRGPMKVPTSGTSVFATTNTPAASAPYAYAGFPVDMVMKTYQLGGIGTEIYDRLRGWEKPTAGGKRLITATTGAEASSATQAWGDYNTGWFGSTFTSNVFWMFGRAPQFLDVICYTGDGTTGRLLNHNLGATPTFILSKARNASGSPSGLWQVYIAGGTATFWGSDAANFGLIPYSNTQVQVPSLNANRTNTSGTNYVAYIFGDLAGVSKTGSYSGTDAAQTINCGFSSGARFVLISQVFVSPETWYVFDTARGIISGADPYLDLTTTSAEVTTTDVLTPASSGFALTGSTFNASGSTYVYYAIA